MHFSTYLHKGFRDKHWIENIRRGLWAEWLHCCTGPLHPLSPGLVEVPTPLHMLHKHSNASSRMQQLKYPDFCHPLQKVRPELQVPGLTLVLMALERLPLIHLHTTNKMKISYKEIMSAPAPHPMVLRRTLPTHTDDKQCINPWRLEKEPILEPSDKHHRKESSRKTCQAASVNYREVSHLTYIIWFYNNSKFSSLIKLGLGKKCESILNYPQEKL